MTLEAVFMIFAVVCGLSFVIFLITAYMDVDFAGFFGFVFIMSLIGLFVCAVIGSGRDKDALIAQCMADGKKEYQCHAMLDDHDQTIPVFIPMYTGR